MNSPCPITRTTGGFLLPCQHEIRVSEFVRRMGKLGFDTGFTEISASCLNVGGVWHLNLNPLERAEIDRP